MNSVQSIFSPAITEALGWTIIHALWQGFVVLIALLFLLALLNKYSAQVRYFISFTALIVFLGWSASTFVKGYAYAMDKEKLKSELLNNPDYFKNVAQHSLQQETAPLASTNFNIQTVKIRAWFQRNFPILLSIWLIGIGLFTVRLLGGLAYNRRLRTLQLLPFEEKWMNKLKNFATTLNLNREVRAYKSPHTASPLTLGIFKPIILFPVKAFSGLSEKEIEAIIAHELAHIIRNDYLFNIIHSVIEILFFYHPAVWSISAHIRAEREHACDDIAINITGDQVSYAKALTHAHVFSAQEENLSMAFTGKKGSLLERIKRIQKQRVMKTNITEGLIAACIIISSIFLVSFSVGNQFNNYNQAIDQTNEISQSTNISQPPTKPLPPKQMKEKKDSLLNEVQKSAQLMKEKKELSKEIEQAIEIALSEQSQSLSTEIFEEINLALKEIREADIEGALKEARKEIEEAMKEINSDSLQKEIRLELMEAQEEIKRAMKESKDALKLNKDTNEISELSLKAAESSLKIASEVLNNLDLENIVKTSLEAANIAIELAGKQLEEMNIDSLIESEINDAQLENEKNKEELSEEMKQLKKELKQMKKELNQELKELEKTDNKP